MSKKNKSFLKKGDYGTGFKRVMINLSVSDIENLVVVASSNRIPVSNQAASIVAKYAEKECKKLYKEGYDPDQIGLFDSVKRQRLLYKAQNRGGKRR